MWKIIFLKTRRTAFTLISKVKKKFWRVVQRLFYRIIWKKDLGQVVQFGAGYFYKLIFFELCLFILLIMDIKLTRGSRFTMHGIQHYTFNCFLHRQHNLELKLSLFLFDITITINSAYILSTQINWESEITLHTWVNFSSIQLHYYIIINKQTLGKDKLIGWYLDGRLTV